MTILDKRFTVTTFPNKGGQRKEERKLSLRDIATLHEETTVTQKADQPVLKLQRYGRRRSDKHCLRTNENVKGVTGLEIDFDKSGFTMLDVKRTLKDHKLAGLILPSFSWSGDEERFHLLMPCSEELKPADRTRYVEIINGLFDGRVDQQASFTLSQPSFYGRPEGGEQPSPILVEGRSIDAAKELERQRRPKGKDAHGNDEKDESDSGVLYALACKHRRLGGTFEEFCDAAEEDERCAAHLDKQPDRERAFKRAWRNAKKDAEPAFDDESEEPKKKRGSTIDIFWGDADDGSEAMKPLVKGFLFQNTLAAIYGAYGTGKSFVAIDLALRIATGKAWFGNTVSPGAVVYFAPEGYHGLKQRRASWCAHHNEGDIPENFALVRGSLNLLRPDGVTLETLAHEARKKKAKLIILDTLNACFGGGDENDSAAMSKARFELERLRDLSKATVLIIHHAGKDLDRGLRGSSVLGGALDSILLLDNGRIISKPPKGKQKDAEPAETIGFTLESVGKSAVVLPRLVAQFDDEDGPKLNTRQRLGLEVIRDAADLFEAGAPISGEKVTKALKNAKWGPKDGGTWRSAKRSLLEALAAKKLIRMEGECVILLH